VVRTGVARQTVIKIHPLLWWHACPMDCRLKMRREKLDWLDYLLCLYFHSYLRPASLYVAGELIANHTTVNRKH
jgi:hypothetical protein